MAYSDFVTHTNTLNMSTMQFTGINYALFSNEFARNTPIFYKYSIFIKWLHDRFTCLSDCTKNICTYQSTFSKKNGVCLLDNLTAIVFKIVYVYSTEFFSISLQNQINHSDSIFDVKNNKNGKRVDLFSLHSRKVTYRVLHIIGET